jgi:histone acetyltransferase (RNA polymerase elongator complex component)
VKIATVPFFISHQGCPFTCVFCDQRTISGSSGSIPTPGDMRAKVGAWSQTAGGRSLEVAFFGGSFTALPVAVQNQLLDPLQPLLASGDVSSVRISTRPDSIDSDTVSRLAQRGVGTVEIGVQSMDDEVLELSGRGHSAADSETAIRCIRSGGLSAGGQLMPGLPGDSPARSLDSLKRVIEAGASFVRIYPVVVLRGTELARRYLAGEYQPPGVDEGVQLCKRLLHEALRSRVDVLRIGLQANDGLSDETVLAGCWHPALGQLTRSELYFDLLCALLTDVPEGSSCYIHCHPSRLSDVAGHKHKNLERLKQSALQASVMTDRNLLPEEIVVHCNQRTLKGNIVTDLKYTQPKE